MRRIPLAVLCAAVLAALIAAPVAPAKTTERQCAASSPRVAGKKITGKVRASNVNSAQARFASCGQARRVMKKVTALGLEQPRKNVAGFYCKPTVFSTGPDFVRYVCTFRGADTPMFVKLTFAVRYRS